MIPLVVKFRDQRPESVTVRDWNKYGRIAHELAGKHGQEVLLPRHFTPEAKGRYAHQQRTRKYLIRKIKLASIGKAQGGGVVDNLFTGLMQKLLQSTAGLDVYPSRVTIKMVGPRYLTFRPNRSKGSTHPDKAREIKTDTPDEARELFEIVDRSLTEQINEAKTKTEETL